MEHLKGIALFLIKHNSIFYHGPPFCELLSLTIGLAVVLLESSKLNGILS